MDPSSAQRAQPVPIQNNYGQPGAAVPPQGGPTIVVNQVGPAISIQANTSSPFQTTCPYCQSAILTTSVKTFNCATCLLCYCTGICLFCCIQCCRGKDFCCYDAVHSCPNCGKVLAQYVSC